MADIITEDMELDAQLKLALKLPANQLLHSAAGYNWDMNPEIILSVIARREDCSLLTALSIFYAGQPTYYESTGPKMSLWQVLVGTYRRLRRLEPHYHEPKANGQDIISMLLYIQRRVNEGGYRHDPDDHKLGLFNEPRDLLLAPRSRKDRRLSIWHLDPKVVRPALKTSVQKATEQEATVLRQAKRHNAQVASLDPFTRDFASTFEDLFPDAPATKAAKKLREKDPKYQPQ